MPTVTAKCPDCLTEFQPANTWRVKLSDKSIVTYAIIPDHKRVNMTLFGRTVSGDQSCDYSGLVIQLYSQLPPPT